MKESILIIATLLFVSCSEQVAKKERKIVSFNSREMSPREENSIFIQSLDSLQNEISYLKVKVIHENHQLPMKNLVLVIFTETNTFKVKSEAFKHFEKIPNSSNDKVIEKTICMNDCKFVDLKGKKINYNSLKDSIWHSKSVTLRATMFNPNVAKNPYISNLSTSSNLIEIIYE